MSRNLLAVRQDVLETAVRLPHLANYMYLGTAPRPRMYGHGGSGDFCTCCSRAVCSAGVVEPPLGQMAFHVRPGEKAFAVYR